MLPVNRSVMGLAFSLVASIASAETIKLGVLTDLSGQYADISGQGVIVGTQMAVDDLKPELAAAGFTVSVVSVDEGKPDTGAAIARNWIDTEDVDAIVNVPNSAVALAVQDLTRARNRVLLVTGAATTELTGARCSPTTAQWTDDTHALATALALALLQQGLDTWFFITADYAFGRSMQSDATRVITTHGGKVLGSVTHAAGTTDFSSALLQAQASGAKVIALANGGTDTINAIKQSREFQIGKPGAKQRLVAMALFISDVNSLGLDVAQNLLVTTGFYWDRTDATRAWSRRFQAATGRMPTREHAETYSAVRHYLLAAIRSRSKDAAAVMGQMRATPVDDFYVSGGRLRVDGRLMRPEYLARVKTPAESKYAWDYYQLLATLEADQAFLPLSESSCPLR